MENFKELMVTTGLLVEGGGVFIIVLGCLGSTGWFLHRIREIGISKAYHEYRIVLGRAILLGLEILVAGDIIQTVVTAHNLTGVGMLAVIVLIRTFLSMTIQLEIEGKWPWQQTREKV
jgi:uncharacterized membrane protein